MFACVQFDLNHFKGAIEDYVMSQLINIPATKLNDENKVTLNNLNPGVYLILHLCYFYY